MLEAMVAAKTGDDVYGDDPTVNLFEERVAELFGKEAGLFTPTGSLANQLGLRLLVNPGDELIADEKAHVVRAELGAAAVFSGITTRTFSSVKSKIDAQTIFDLLAPKSSPYLVSTTAIAIENTHNFGGGTTQPLNEIEKLRELSAPLGIAMHLDGARIWNAHIATGISFQKFGSLFDTVSVCFSKGLGAPIGSMLLASRSRIEAARIWRKRYGGGMRQVGLLAAAADYALTHQLERLKDDHRHAQLLAEKISQLDSTLIDKSSVETNIVGLDLSQHKITAADLALKLGEQGVLTGALGPKYLRLVTHLDLKYEDIEAGGEIITATLSELL
jgi:threonine aldolase